MKRGVEGYLRGGNAGSQKRPGETKPGLRCLQAIRALFDLSSLS